MNSKDMLLEAQIDYSFRRRNTNTNGTPLSLALFAVGGDRVEWATVTITILIYLRVRLELLQDFLMGVSIFAQKLFVCRTASTRKGGSEFSVHSGSVVGDLLMIHSFLEMVLIIRACLETLAPQEMPLGRVSDATECSPLVFGSLWVLGTKRTPHWSMALADHEPLLVARMTIGKLLRASVVVRRL